MEMTKKMTGRIVLACVLAMLCLGLFACSGSGADAKKAYIGQWKLTEMTENGEAVSADDMAMLDSLGMTIDLTVNEDGTFDLIFFGESQKGDWEAKSATEATFTIEGDSVPATLKDGKLTLSESDVSMTFEKKDDSSKG